MFMSTSRSASLLATVAAASMALAPAAAQARPGWGGGWGGGWGHHHDDGIDAGDVFAGILIIGGIAAIAAAASNANKNRQTRSDDTYRNRDDRDYRSDGRNDGSRYGERDTRPRWQEGSSGINGAVNTCVGEIERSSNRVDTVDNVARDGQGWTVQGRITSGRSFACAVDGDGRIRSATVDGHAAYAREGQDTAAAAAAAPSRYVSQPVVQPIPG